MAVAQDESGTRGDSATRSESALRGGSGTRPSLLITGGSGGIGAATAAAFAGRGFDVALHYAAAAERAAETARRCRAQGAVAETFRADLLEPGAGTRLAQAVLSRFGRIDVVINNAALPARPLAFAKHAPDDFRAHFQVAVGAASEIAVVLLPGLAESKGAILNVATSYALATPAAKLSAYVTAKHALLGLTRSLAVELAPKGIRVNAVAPGVTETPMIDHLPDLFRQQLAQQVPLRRLARPEDVAGALLFLASAEAAYITGAVIPVCGGTAMPS